MLLLKQLKFCLNLMGEACCTADKLEEQEIFNPHEEPLILEKGNTGRNTQDLEEEFIDLIKRIDFHLPQVKVSFLYAKI